MHISVKFSLSTTTYKWCNIILHYTFFKGLFKVIEINYGDTCKCWLFTSGELLLCSKLVCHL